MTDSTQEKKQDSVDAKLKSKKEWIGPEVLAYDYAAVTQGGVNAMGVDDIAGDNYSLS
tara:strand:+ start:949 stop:1122 length:174 start_codon:yes stop_codon:yes gene_type:complete